MLVPEILILVVFILGYAAIALEHNIHIDKAASALITGVACWGIYVLTAESAAPHLLDNFKHFVHENNSGSHILGKFFEHRVLHHLGEIASILFFLMGAMTIVELVDAHEGFSVITDRIKTNNQVKLLWILCILTFFFSALLDNLTSTIVMISLIRKLIDDQKIRWFFAGIIVIAANAGGAWSPIGDVTTTMLWIKGQLPNVPQMITHLFIPSLVAMLVPLAILSFTLKGTVKRPVVSTDSSHYQNPTTSGERNLVFLVGIAGLLFVPIFKTITHLPPFMGMMFSLGVLWVVTEILHRSKNKEEKQGLSVISVLQKIDTPSVLFFLGILLAVSALQDMGLLIQMAEFLDNKFGNIYVINTVIGILSAIVDNVPLVAAAQGMYDVPLASADLDAYRSSFVAGGNFWQLLAFCAGTGGSMLIIGSAAGVAAMGLERINFFWYIKKISLLALVGYLAGILTFYLMFGA